MSAWAYRCHPCVEGEADWFVSQLDVERLGPDVQIVRVRVGRDWKCPLLDRTQAVVVDNQLLRNVIVSDEADCPECAEMLATAMPAGAPGQQNPCRQETPPAIRSMRNPPLRTSQADSTRVECKPLRFPYRSTGSLLSSAR